MSEIDRFNFLVNRDGLQSALEWEERTAKIYHQSAANCFKDTISGVKGTEWANKYLKAARECEELILNSYIPIKWLTKEELKELYNL